MCEYRKECFNCLSNEQCLPMAQYDSLYCIMMREFDYKSLGESNANRTIYKTNTKKKEYDTTGFSK